MSKKVEQTIFISSGKKPRNELRLPNLHFIVVDDWIPKLSEKTFCYWLILLSLVDRTDSAKSKYGNINTVPRSLENLAKEVFNMSKSTFYRNVIHPLWDYGFIDLVEWGESLKLGQKPLNIIVYDYPQNSYELAVKPLEKCRDYKTEYNSDCAIFGRLGGQVKKDENISQNEDEANRFKNETVNNIRVSNEKADLNNGFKNETVNGSKNETVTVSKMKPINISNTIINDTNTIINDTNTILSIYDSELSKMKFSYPIEVVLQKKIDRLMSDQIDLNEILIVWEAEKNTVNGLNEYQFADMLYTALTHAKEKIGSKGSVSNFIKAAIKQYKENMNNEIHKTKTPIRTEIIPSHFDKEDEHQKDSSHVDPIELERKKAKLQETLKQIKNAQAN